MLNRRAFFGLTLGVVSLLVQHLPKPVPTVMVLPQGLPQLTFKGTPLVFDKPYDITPSGAVAFVSSSIPWSESSATR